MVLGKREKFLSFLVREVKKNEGKRRERTICHASFMDGYSTKVGEGKEKGMWEKTGRDF